LHDLCKKAGVKNGVVQDKLWLASFVKLKRLIETGFFGKILSVRGEFGYWVFEGHTIPAQRPSWNYRKEDDGGIIVDMLCHWQYVLENLFGEPKAISCYGATHIAERVDEQGKPYKCTADDAAYATFELEGGVVAHFNSSWVTRVRRDDLLTVQVDGEKGSAVCGLRDVWIQHYGNTPRPTWNPDIPQPINFFEGWAKVPDQETYDNAFKIQWELFLRHIVLDEPFPWDLLRGAKGVQFAELGLKSWAERQLEKGRAAGIEAEVVESLAALVRKASAESQLWARNWDLEPDLPPLALTGARSGKRSRNCTLWANRGARTLAELCSQWGQMRSTTVRWGVTKP
jgi:predicted dehydrogenase